jgi:hypothetical protein
LSPLPNKPLILLVNVKQLFTMLLLDAIVADDKVTDACACAGAAKDCAF